MFGATVDLEDQDGGNKVVYQIVGDAEADIKSGLISVSSPIARALVGKSQGDVVDVVAPNGTRTYEIVAVEIRVSGRLAAAVARSTRHALGRQPLDDLRASSRQRLFATLLETAMPLARLAARCFTSRPGSASRRGAAADRAAARAQAVRCTAGAARG